MEQFPYLVLVNSLIPALLAGNSVIIKPSPQTPVQPEELAKLFLDAGLPADVFQVVHLTYDGMLQLAGHPQVNFVSFTGSTSGGDAIDTVARGRKAGFKGVALELGGKDAAYVRSDADIPYTAAEVVDGAMFNSGQSCCAIERVYVHESVYDRFVEEVTKVVKVRRRHLGFPPRSNAYHCLGTIRSGV
jgi:acyl-CoA reductase-like NAD-dependent aldehyde dehydrogenase